MPPAFHLNSVAADFAMLRARADELDQVADFPAEALDTFVNTQLLSAPIPIALGGQGLGTSPASGKLLARLLRDLGATWLPLARVFEGHVNALRLIFRYGDAAQAARAADDCRDHLFAIWAAEIRPVHLNDGVLQGTKSFASGAGVVTRPLITAQSRQGEVLVLIDLPPGRERIVGKPDLLGMRGAGTAAVELDGLVVDEEDVVGRPGDYMRQPEISLGSWRPLPALLGALESVIELVGAHLRARGRDRDPIQLARFGQMVLAAETASLWVSRVAVAAEAEDADERAATLVKLARHAIDQACSLILDNARHAIGLASFVRPHPVERLCRDIDTYRRQPALDEVLLEAAQHHLAKG